MRVLTRLSDQSCAALMDRAARFLGGPPVSAFGGDEADLAREENPPHIILVHDLMPDPVAQIEWLHSLHREHPDVSFFLLLPPRGDAVVELARRGAGLPLIGVEIVRQELSPEALARSLREAFDDLADERQLWERTARWPVPPNLRYVAQAELRFAPRNASLDQVLRLAGVSYEGTRRAAATVGLPPPRRFVEALRLLRVVSVLERGEKVKTAAPAYGFHDAERLERRMRRHFGMTPTDAREVGAQALLRRLEREWFGDRTID